MKTIEIPKDGLAGLKENWSTDALSGFLVFLLALPLSLGIAKASGFPAAMGVLTAMIGGLVVSIFQGGRLTIKGPAAGLITVCAGAVAEFTVYVKQLNPGITDIEAASNAVALTCGVIVVMAIFQVVLGFLKMGSLSDFFPHSAVHGMLAAIGVLIFAKQFPVLLGVDSALTKGLTPIQLYTHIPLFIQNATPQIAIVGILSLVIIFGLPALGGVFKKIPAPMIVLLVMIPLAILLGFKADHPASLVSIGKFWANVKFNASFAAIGTGIFWKYVVMFLFVNSLESLLTVKAIDGLDPYKRQSDYNKDLSALALGNGLSGLLGGLPMISEVARSSANVGNGARTRWANFFHGLFLFLAMLLLIPVIEMIPTAALAAMLIAVAYRLASPKEFINTYKVGIEQLVIFVVTIVVTVAEDLLMGVAAGIVTKFIFHIINGAPVGSLFKAKYDLTEGSDSYTIKIKDSAIFSNFLGYKKLWSKLTPGKKLTFDFTEARLVDHSFMEQLHHFEEDYHHSGGTVTILGLDTFRKLSNHPMAARKHAAGEAISNDTQLSSRQVELDSFAKSNGFTFNAQKVRNAAKFKDFPIQKGSKILYEESLLQKSIIAGKIEFSDSTLTEISLHAKTDSHITLALVTETKLQIPDFALEPEGLWLKLSAAVRGKDFDFHEFPVFSKKYHLKGSNENAIREFFTESVVRFLENEKEIHIESHSNKLLVYKKRDLLNPAEIQETLIFVEAFVNIIKKHVSQPV